MKTLQLYLTRQVLASLVMTVAVFTFVLLLANVLREVMSMLLNKQASLMTVANAIGLLIPWVLVFALPMGMLTATLLVFGRFSADNELTAIRSGGVSLVALISPILLLSVALSGVCAVINMQVAPQCRVAYKRLLSEMGVRMATSLLTEKTFIKDFKDYIIYADKIDGPDFKDALIFHLTSGEGGQQVDFYYRAASGRYEVDPTNNLIKVKLVDVWRVNMWDGRWVWEYAKEGELAPAHFGQSRKERTKLSDMTFLQLWDELRELEQQAGLAIPFQKGSTNAPARRLATGRPTLPDITLPVKVQIHRQVSFSFACIGFTLVGIPLGIRAHRRETTFGIGLALVLVGIYYSFFILGSALEMRPDWAPHLILWIPNFIFQAVGVVLLWRANRGV